jgi:hypothetical protein
MTPHANDVLSFFETMENEDPDYKQLWQASKPYRVIADKLVDLRCQSDLTQGQLAKRLHIPFAIYKLMEGFNYEEVPDYWFVNVADQLGLPFEMTWHLKQVD